MKKVLYTVAALAGTMLAAPAAFAQAAAPAAGGTNWVAISAAFGMALAAFGGALAQSRVASAACESMARDPGGSRAIRASLILRLVVNGAPPLLALAVTFAKASA